MSTLYTQPVLCIAGPTASGKSAVAVKLAKLVDGEVINADALQVYRDLKIISARPEREEMQGVPHHLFGHIDGARRYSVGAWRDDAVPVILDVLARGKVPIITGGTGLYFKALTQGLADIPDIKAGVRANVLRDLEGKGVEYLRAEADIVDPVAAARILGDDPARLTRLVEVKRSTGKALSEWQAQTHPIIPKGYWRGAVLLPERAPLYERINKRFDMMAENGGFDEVKTLIARDLPTALPVMKAIGVPQIMSVLTGQVSAQVGIEAAKRETRRFAKRQYTWFRGQAKNWTFCESGDEILRIWKKIPQIRV